MPRTVRDAVDMLRGATAQLFRTIGSRPDGHAVFDDVARREARPDHPPGAETEALRGRSTR